MTFRWIYLLQGQYKNLHSFVKHAVNKTRESLETGFMPVVEEQYENNEGIKWIKTSFFKIFKN